MADTVIGEGTKIDNLVQVAHNVRIGRGCVIAGHCGISGSVTLGDGVMLGRQGRHRRPRQRSARARRLRRHRRDGRHSGRRDAGAVCRRMPMREFFREVAAMKKLTKGRKGKHGWLMLQRRRSAVDRHHGADEASAASLSVPAGRQDHRHRWRQFGDRHQERDGQRAAFPGPFPGPAGHAGRADRRGMAQTAGAICIHNKAGASLRWSIS